MLGHSRVPTIGKNLAGSSPSTQNVLAARTYVACLAARPLPVSTSHAAASLTQAAAPPPPASLLVPAGRTGQAQRSVRAASAAAASQATAVSAQPSTPADGSRPASMPSIRAELIDLFRASITTAYPDVAAANPPMVAPCQQSKFGDYQCNNAMGLFGRLKGNPACPKAPRDVANALVAGLPADSKDLIAETSLAGPGFINIRLSREFLAKRISSMLAAGGVACWAPNQQAGKRVVVDFSSPNVAKEMHVGHLRSTIIGDTICRVLEYCGADVLRLNHVGDWGTQFGMLIQHMAESRPGGLGEEGGSDEDVSDLMALYRASKKRFDEEEDFKTRAREAVTRLQSGDAAFMAAWRRICEASRREFNAVYARLGVTLSERGESFYNPMLKDVVDELTAKGIAEVNEGAVCVFVEGHQVPLIVQKSDGGFGYASTDMAALKQRLNDEKADWVIYVTDMGQSGHFDLVFGAAKKAGWLKEEAGAPKVSHVGFGLVLGDDGKRFRTRSSELVRLVDLLDEAKSRCATNLRERRTEAGEEVDEAEIESAASAMGYGAVKYADLKNHRTTNYKFSYDDMLSLKGNTAVYLLYAHARIAGIVRKSGRDVAELAKSGTSIKLGNSREEDLALHIVRLPEAVEDMLDDLAPNRLTDYLYELSEKFNSFYTECKVIGSEEEESRLMLCEATAVVMRQCFYLLGITPLYRI